MVPELRSDGKVHQRPLHYIDYRDFVNNIKWRVYRLEKSISEKVSQVRSLVLELFRCLRNSLGLLSTDFAVRSTRLSTSFASSVVGRTICLRRRNSSCSVKTVWNLWKRADSARNKGSTTKRSNDFWISTKPFARS